MARKKPEGKDEEMQADAKEAAQPRRKPGRKPGPFWRTQAGHWAAIISGRQIAAPKTIGPYNVQGARAWYEKLKAEHEAGVKPSRQVARALDEDLPGTPTRSGTRSLYLYMTPAVAADLKELAPIVAAEHLMAKDSYSLAISVAIVEALAARKAREKNKG